MSGQPIQIRLEEATIERLDKLAESITEELRESVVPRKATRSDAIRAALAAGIEELERRHKAKRRK
jgi:predicted transcriptional regulator